MQIETIMKLSPVIPVLTIEDAKTAVPLARALVQGGVRVLEVTLRTPHSLAAIRAITSEVRDAVVGAGTVLNESDLMASRDAGAVFAVSPGSTPALLGASLKTGIPLLPGIASASELMMGLSLGFHAFKFFPAESIGGVSALKALSAPFARVAFCPTGGINLAKAKEYLTLSNVHCVGGSWLAPASALAQQDWRAIESLASEAIAALRK